MVFATSADPSDGRDPAPGISYVPAGVHRTAKILVVGAFGVGKTTLIGSVSEITPLRTEETMTTASAAVDDLAGLAHKTTTTVAMDFGRITLNEQLVLYLFGTPGQRRFWTMWAGLADGAVGILVLVDVRRLADSFEVLDQLETRDLAPFAVAVNRFPDTPDHSADQVRAALDLEPGTPLIECDATDRASSVTALAALAGHALGVRAGRPTHLQDLTP